MTECVQVVILATHGKRFGSMNHSFQQPRSAKNDLRLNLRPNCNENYKHWIPYLSKCVPRNEYVHFPETLEACYRTDTEQMRTYPWKLLIVLPEKTPNMNYSIQVIASDCRRWNSQIKKNFPYILLCYMEYFWRQIREFPTFWLRIEYGVHTKKA